MSANTYSVHWMMNFVCEMLSVRFEVKQKITTQLRKVGIHSSFNMVSSLEGAYMLKLVAYRSTSTKCMRGGGHSTWTWGIMAELEIVAAARYELPGRFGDQQ